jgi:hypothetical protein
VKSGGSKVTFGIPATRAVLSAAATKTLRVLA